MHLQAAPWRGKGAEAGLTVGGGQSDDRNDEPSGRH